MAVSIPFAITCLFFMSIKLIFPFDPPTTAKFADQSLAKTSPTPTSWYSFCFLKSPQGFLPYWETYPFISPTKSEFRFWLKIIVQIAFLFWSIITLNSLWVKSSDLRIFFFVQLRFSRLEAHRSYFHTSFDTPPLTCALAWEWNLNRLWRSLIFQRHKHDLVLGLFWRKGK